ncbi:hypothetical protein GGF32_004326 [Allomyces javanicus]|nr:hypothetical protein GGF32_004326 [Allomyces javanicus]
MAVTTSISREAGPLANCNTYIQDLISIAMQGGKPTAAWVRQSVQAAAAVTKRQYTTDPNLLMMVIQQLHDPSDADLITPRLGSLFALMYVRALLDVFNDAKIAPSPVVHTQCQRHFQTHHLNTLLKQVITELLRLLPVAQTQLSHFTQTTLIIRFGLACELLERHLSWDFSTHTFEPSYTSSSDVDLSPVDLPAAWAPILLDPQVVPMLFAWTALAATTSSDHFRVPLHRMFQSLNLLSCAEALPRTLSESPAEQTRATVAFCTSLVQGMHQLLAIMAKQFNGPLLNGIGGILRRIGHHFAIDTVLAHVPGFLEFLKDIGRLTVVSLQLHGKSEEERSWLEEAGQELLAMWARVASQALRLRAENSLPQAWGHDLASLANQIVQAFVHEKMSPPAEELDEDNFSEDLDTYKDWETYEDTLTDVATLARLDAATSAAYLTSALQSTIQRFPTLSMDALCAHWEATHWLLLITGSFLADKAENEVALVPAELVAVPGASVQQLAQAMLQLLDFLCATPSASSPTVMESQWWVLERWVKCYVLAAREEYSHAGPLLDAFGASALQFVVVRAATVFQQYGAESGVLTQVIRVLLGVSKVRVLRQAMLQLPEFYDLARQFMQGLDGFPEAVYSGMVEAIIRIGTAAQSGEGMDLVANVVNSISTEFAKLAGTRDLQAPRNLQRLTRCLEMLTGVASATDISNVTTLAPALLPFFTAFPGMMTSVGYITELWPYVFDILYRFSQGDVFMVLEPAQTQAVLTAYTALAFEYCRTSTTTTTTTATGMILEEERKAVLCVILDTAALLAEERDRTDLLAAVIGAWVALVPHVVHRAALEIPSVALTVARVARTLLVHHQPHLHAATWAQIPLAHVVPASALPRVADPVAAIWTPLGAALAFMVRDSVVPNVVAAGLEAAALVDAGVCPAAAEVADELLATLVHVALFQRTNSEHLEPLATAVVELASKRPQALVRVAHLVAAQNPKAVPVLEQLVAATRMERSDYWTAFCEVVAQAKGLAPSQL